MNYRDLVHNAYIYYHKKSNGGNIFEQHEGYMLRCVKFIWRWSLDHRYYMMNRKLFLKKIFEYDTASDLFAANPSYADGFCNNPHEEMESKEVVDLIYKRVAQYHSGGESSVDPQALLRVLDYLQLGYTGREIGKEMGISEQTASNYKKKLKELVENFIHPSPN